MLDTANELKSRGASKIKFVFIGDGKLKPELQARAEREQLSNCLFFDPIPKNKLASILGTFDVGLMILDNVPAFYYGTSPNKFFDYLAAGLPVVNNYPGWLAGLIRENNCGVEIAPSDPVKFADALETLSEDKEQLALMGKNARALGEKEFDRDLLGGRFVNYLESVYEASLPRQ